MRLGVAPGFVQITFPVTFGYQVHDDSAVNGLSKTIAGWLLPFSNETSGKYPGGIVRLLDRLAILTRASRPLSLTLLAKRQWCESWRIYHQTWLWNARLGRIRYMPGFILKALATVCSRQREVSPQTLAALLSHAHEVYLRIVKEKVQPLKRAAKRHETLIESVSLDGSLWSRWRTITQELRFTVIVRHQTATWIDKSAKIFAVIQPCALWPSTMRPTVWPVTTPCPPPVQLQAHCAESRSAS